MTSTADDVIAALRSGHDDLRGYVVNLNPEQLTAPSGATEWTVAQVLSHLGSGAEISLATLEQALADGSPLPQDFNRGVWERWDAMGPVRHRDGFVDANERLVQRYESLDEATRDRLRIDFGFLPAPVSVADAARLRLSEFALHAWDVRVVAEPATTIAPEAVPPLLESTVLPLEWIAKPENIAGRPVELGVELAAPSRSFGLRLADTASVIDRPDQPDAVVYAPAEAWLRLLSGRLGADRTPAEVRVEGAVSLDDLRKVFPGY